MLKGKLVPSGLSDLISAGWFSLDFSATLDHSVKEMASLFLHVSFSSVI